MSIICKFKKLEILELTFPKDEKILPKWIGELCNLRVLDLSQYFHLEQISHDVLPKLAMLEELYTPRDHDTQWSHAFLKELIHLPCLRVLTGWFAGNDEFDSRQQNMMWSNQYWRARMLRLDDFDDESIKIFKRFLPKVGCLDIGMKLMPDLKNLCPQLDDTGFQYLSNLKLSDSTSLQCLVDTATLMTADVLPNLLDLSLSRMKQLRRMICNGSPPHLNFLGSLKSLLILHCPKIENLVPDILPVAPQLEKLYIWSCEAIKSLYDQEQTKRVHQLPLLSCESEKHKLNVGLGDAELHTMTLDAMLISLTEVDIAYCSNLEEVFPDLEVNHQHSTWKLAKLVELNLKGLPKLKCIWKSPEQNYRLLNIRIMNLSKCDKLSTVFTPTLAQSLGKLECLVINKCAMLESIISPDKQDELLTGKPEISFTSRTCFPELKTLFVKSCNKLKTVLPIAFAAKFLPKVKHITVIKCEVLEEVFGASHEYSQTQDVVMENQISLELVDLPKLVPFSEFTWNQMLTSLLTLKISGTTFKQDFDIVLAEAQEEMSNGMLPIRAAASLREMEVDSESFFSRVEEIFDVEDAQQPILTGLHVLKLRNMPKVQYLWRGPAKFISLSNLKKIKIYNCPAIKSLFPNSFCWTLHSLKSLKVYDCKELKNIFEPSDHGEHSLHDQCFPKLETLHVGNCEILENIFPFFVVDFPCLKSVKVHDCPNLENININGSRTFVQLAM